MNGVWGRDDKIQQIRKGLITEIKKLFLDFRGWLRR